MGISSILAGQQAVSRVFVVPTYNPLYFYVEGQTVFSLQEQMPKKVVSALLLIWPSLEDESAASQRLWKSSSDLNLSPSTPVSAR